MKNLKIQFGQTPQYLTAIIGDQNKGIQGVIQLPGQKFSYGIERNIHRFNLKMKEIKHFEQSLYDEKSPNYVEIPLGKEYEEKKQALCKKYATKDEKGELVLQRNQDNQMDYVFEPDARKQFDIEFADLNKEFQITIAAVETRRLKMIEFLNSETEVEIHVVNEPDVSPYINTQQRMDISWMLEDVPVSNIITPNHLNKV